MKCFKCKQLGHVIADCPCWDEAPSNRWKHLHCNGFARMDSHTKLSKKKDPTSSSSMRPVTDINARAIIDSNMKKISQLNRACTNLTLDSEEEITDIDSDDEEFYKRIGRSNAYVAIESSKDFIKSDVVDNASSD